MYNRIGKGIQESRCSACIKEYKIGKLKVIYINHYKKLGCIK